MESALCAALAALLLLQIASAAAADAVVNVTLPYGTVQGLSTATGVSYFDIPFALPPTGERRWRAPEPWEGQFSGGVLDGTHSRNIACTQFSYVTMSFVGTEDCLTLNVFAPANATGSALLPVLFWIHGGGWVEGSATDACTDGRLLATQTGSVVVSVHYRLGIYGFLALDELLREAGDTGNYGIHDLVEALRWVQAHIAAFGGDKDRVAVFGESAGGGNTMLLTSLPSTRGLFHAAISESGPGAGGAWLPVQRAKSQRVASQLGCSDSATLLACLRSKSAAEVTQHAGWMYGEWIPTIDGALIKGTSESRMASGDFNRVPFIVGTNANDGGFAMAAFRTPVSRAQLAELLPRMMPASVQSNATLLTRAVALYPAVDDADNRQVLVDCSTDQMFSCAARRYARAASKWVETYGYVWWGSVQQVLVDCSTDQMFSCAARRYARAASKWVETYGYVWWGSVQCAGRPIVSCHADEIDSLFQNNAVCRLNETGLALGQAMNHYWASMAAHGNPNEGRMAGSPVWEASNGDKWQALDPAGIHEIPTIRGDRCDFWDEVFDIENTPAPSPPARSSSSAAATPSLSISQHSGSKTPVVPSSHTPASSSASGMLASLSATVVASAVLARMA
eukprot:m51a1_g14642 hypothetical protein (624) ;mRNA; f:60060-62264